MQKIVDEIVYCAVVMGIPYGKKDNVPAVF